MPLRDHFHPPLGVRRSWEAVHCQWPAMIVIDLSRRLPARYVAEPSVHFGSSIEVDVATFEEEASASTASFNGGNGGGVATAVWAPPRPTLAFATNWPAQDEYEVRIYDTRDGRRLVAAIEIVSPANKDRPESRRAFVAKCAALLEDRVCVAIVDLVTNRTANLNRELLDLIGGAEASRTGEATPIYAATWRPVRKEAGWLIETWAEPLVVGRPLPTLPLWLAADLVIPVDLESSYEETCRILRLP